MKNNPELAVIIVSYNSAENIAHCLKSIQRHLKVSHEIILVDNHSTDQTLQQVRQTKVPAKIIANNKNVGFSTANNQAAHRTSAEYLFFLNPDTELLADNFTELLDYLKTHPEVGIVGPKLKLSDGRTQTSIKPAPTLGRAMAEYWFGQTGAYAERAPQGDQPEVVEATYGAALCISRQFYLQIGGFDNRYFIYYEDLDLCRKVRQAGKQVVCLPTVSLLHHLGRSTRQIGQQRLAPGLRTLANFWPLKASGSNYYQLVSGNLYHGKLVAFLIRIVIYLGQKLRGR